MSPETELTEEKLGEWLRRHKEDCKRMRYLKDLYEGRHPIQLMPKKDAWKPDNRIICNHAKYIVDRFNGFFLGIPVKTRTTTTQSFPSTAASTAADLSCCIRMRMRIFVSPICRRWNAL